MYQMTPIYFNPDDAVARHSNTIARAVLIVLGAITMLALALIVLAATHIAWLSLLNDYGAASSPVIFRLLLSGI